MWSERGLNARRPWVRIPYENQTSGVINLKLTGSKLSIGYGVMEHSRTEYEVQSQKGDAGLRFESLLVSKIKATIAQLVELLICNQQVGGSSPSCGSKNISRDGLEMVPAESHKLNHVGSNPTPATNCHQH